MIPCTVRAKARAEPLRAFMALSAPISSVDRAAAGCPTTAGAALA
jgi:hypothetical protein